VNARIPADVDRPDKVLGPLTLRQLVILAATGVLLWLVWTASHPWLPMPVFLVFALPVGAAATAIALGQRDGLPLDKLLLAALRQRLAPQYQVAAPEGVRPVPSWVTAAIRDDASPTRGAGRGHAGARSRSRGSGAAPGERIDPAALRLPAQAVDAAHTAPGDVAVVDLGGDGLAVVAVTSTVNFALRTENEQDGLVASFGRFLHSLSGAVQILVRTQRLDLSDAIAELHERAGGLPHPALEAAALDHADYLAHLATNTDLWRRQVLLVLREPLGPAAPPDGLGGPSPAAALGSLLTSRSTRRRDRAGDAAGSAADATNAVVRAAEARLVRRLTEASDLLGAAGIAVTPLSAGQATTVLASACNPDTLLPASADLAGADEVITGPSNAHGWSATSASTAAYRGPDDWSPGEAGWQPDHAGYAEDSDDYADYTVDYTVGDTAGYAADGREDYAAEGQDDWSYDDGPAADGYAQDYRQPYADEYSAGYGVDDGVNGVVSEAAYSAVDNRGYRGEFSDAYPASADDEFDDAPLRGQAVAADARRGGRPSPRRGARNRSQR
jgi:hypothetical protein